MLNTQNKTSSQTSENMPFSGKKRRASEINDSDLRASRKFGVMKPKDPFEMTKIKKDVNRNQSSVFLATPEP